MTWNLVCFLEWFSDFKENQSHWKIDIWSSPGIKKEYVLQTVLPSLLPYPLSSILLAFLAMIYNTKRAAPQYSFKQNGRYQVFGVAAERKMAYLQIGSDNILRWEKAPSYNSFYYTHFHPLYCLYWYICNGNLISLSNAFVKRGQLDRVSLPCDYSQSSQSQPISSFPQTTVWFSYGGHFGVCLFPKKIRGLLFRNMVALSSCDDDGKMGIKSHGNIKTSRLSSTLDNDSRLNIFHRNFSLISIKHVHVCSLGCLGLIS